MSFEDELAKRTANARETINQQEEESKIRAKKAMATDKIILETKELIESEFATVAKYYRNAKVHPTHDIEKGQVVAHFGTFTCSILECAADKDFNFPLPVIFAIQVIPADDLNNLRLTSAHLINRGNTKNVYSDLLSILRDQARLNNYCYDGSIDKKLISESIKAEVIRLIDKAQSELNPH